jgi:hypothetical protein
MCFIVVLVDFGVRHVIFTYHTIVGFTHEGIDDVRGLIFDIPEQTKLQLRIPLAS